MAEIDRIKKYYNDLKKYDCIAVPQSLLSNRKSHKGGSPKHSGSVQAPRPGGPGSNLGVSKILDDAELIDSKDSAIKLNKLIEPIQYW